MIDLWNLPRWLAALLCRFNLHPAWQYTRRMFWQNHPCVPPGNVSVDGWFCIYCDGRKPGGYRPPSEPPGEHSPKECS